MVGVLNDHVRENISPYEKAQQVVGFDCVIVDSPTALDHLKDFNIKPSAKVVTTSIEVTQKNSHHVLSFDDMIPAEVRNHLQAVIHELAHEIFKIFYSNGYNYYFALRVAKSPYRFIGIFLRALFIKYFNNYSYCLILERKDASTYYSWKYLVKNAENIEYRTYTMDENGSMSLADPPFLKRLLFYPKKYFEYKFWLLFWKFLPLNRTKGTFYIGATNFLLIESIPYLARNGYSIKQLPKVSNHQECDFDNFVETPVNFSNIFFSKLNALDLDAKIVNNIVNIFLEHVEKEFNFFSVKMNHYYKFLYQQEKSKAILSNMPDEALAAACHKLNIPVVAYQHGHGREFASHHHKISLLLEERLSDLFLTYNKQAVNASKSNPYCIAEIEDTGTPTVYRSNRIMSSLFKNRYDILYVSTNIYNGLQAEVETIGLTDCDKVNLEKNLISLVFSKVNSKIIFKPYPASNTSSMSLTTLKQFLSETSNVYLMEKNYNLYQMIYQSRLVITSRATSTFGWCLLSNKPVIYLDHGEHYGLLPEAKQKMKESCFYFNLKHPKVFEDLRSFLQQDFRSIKKQWLNKKKSRNYFINEYFNSCPRNSGKKAAQNILKFIQNDRNDK